MAFLKYITLLSVFGLVFSAGSKSRRSLTDKNNKFYMKDSEPVWDYQEQILKQGKEIDNLKDLVKSIENIVLHQSIEIISQKHTIEELTGQLTKLTNQQQDISKANSLSSKQQNVAKTNIKECKRILTKDTFAFHSVNDLTVTHHINLNQALLFPTNLLNRGKAYHEAHSIFIAVTPGIYIFSASVLSYVGEKSEYSAAIVKNGVNLALIYGHGDSGRHDQGSVTVVTELTNGDEVWVRMLTGDASIWGGRYTSFTGAILYEV
ncbi:hypothetical protein ACF0H5_022611 [Mactra antiquata]